MIASLRRSDRLKARQRHPERQLTFLGLPAEIRVLIYRFLLCQDEPIHYSKDAKLSPTILRTCRQILSEAGPILYEENVWKMKISKKSGTANLMTLHHMGQYVPDPFDRFLLLIKRFNIVVEIRSEREMAFVRRAVTEVSKFLSERSDLHYVHIKLCACEVHGGGAQEFHRALENFTLLRHVREVVVDGVSPEYAEYLTRKMTGSAPLDHLPKCITT